MRSVDGEGVAARTAPAVYGGRGERSAAIGSNAEAGVVAVDPVYPHLVTETSG